MKIYIVYTDTDDADPWSRPANHETGILKTITLCRDNAQDCLYLEKDRILELEIHNQ